MISSSTAVADALILIYCGTAKSTNPEILVQILWALVPYLIIALVDNNNKS
jgi:hypothetical protein